MILCREPTHYNAARRFSMQNHFVPTRNPAHDSLYKYLSLRQTTMLHPEMHSGLVLGKSTMICTTLFADMVVTCVGIMKYCPLIDASPVRVFPGPPSNPGTAAFWQEHSHVICTITLWLCCDVTLLSYHLPCKFNNWGLHVWIILHLCSVHMSLMCLPSVFYT